MALTELKETRFAKLSLSGVADFEGAFDGPEDAERGVDRPEVSFCLTLGNKRPEFIGGGLRVSLEELGVQLKPFRSSMIVVLCEVAVGKCLEGSN